MFGGVVVAVCIIIYANRRVGGSLYAVLVYVALGLCL